MRSNKIFTFFMYSRYNNLFKGVSWVVASSIIGSVLQFLLIFVLLNFYKQEEFGLWASITSIAAVIVTGDFNAEPESDVIKHMTDAENPKHLQDTRLMSPIVYGPSWSFHDFGKIPYDKRPLIDYVFVRNDLKVLRYGVLAETEGSEFLSDHAPVLVTVE